MTEAFLHYIWKYKMLRGSLVTTTGLPVLVQKVGEHNHDAGPDFLDTRVTIDGLQWAGNVEVHVKSSDWNLHRHQTDPAYNNVILHVVYIHDMDVLLENGKSVPTIEIKDFIPTEVWKGYAALMQPALPIEIPCMLRISEVPKIHLDVAIERLTVERLERKATDVRRLLQDSKGDWETCCYWMLVRYFGGKTNAFAFEMLAKQTPQYYLGKIKDFPFRIEALLMGQAGLLGGEFKDEFPRSLQKEYRYLAASYQLTPMEGHLWKFFRLRPSNFPTIRISQLANLVSKSEHLFSKLLDTTSAVDLYKLFDLRASDYWQNHYRFDQESERITKNVGKTFVETLLINSWIPLLFEYGVQHGDESRKDQALNLLQQINPEKNHITKMWASMGIEAADAGQSQAQIQLYNEYCKNKRCLDCRIGYQLLKPQRKKDITSQ